MDSNNLPLVSVIIATYNGENTIKRAIDSILKQSYKNIEVIVCDDASTDKTYDFLQEEYGDLDNILLIKNASNKGLAHSLNKCIEVSKGKYIARMDDDDISHLDRIEKQVEFLTSHPEYAVVGTSKNYFDENGVWGSDVTTGERSKLDIYLGRTFTHPSVMMCSNALKDVGCYTDNHLNRRSQDYDLWCKFYYRGYKGYVMQDILLDYYESCESIKRRKVKYQFDKFIKTIIWFYKLKIPLKYSYVPAMELAKCVVPNKIKLAIHKKRFV